LKIRWPGTFVPSIPEKKITGSETPEFLEVRRSLLESFMKDCAKHDYIISSPEFQLFSRGQGEVDKQLEKLRGESPAEILLKY